MDFFSIRMPHHCYDLYIYVAWCKGDERGPIQLIHCRCVDNLHQHCSFWSWTARVSSMFKTVLRLLFM